MSWHNSIWFEDFTRESNRSSKIALLYCHLSFIYTFHHADICRPDSLIKSSVVKRYVRRCWGFAWSMRLGHPPSDCPVWIVWRCPFWTIQDFPDGRTQDILHSPTGCTTTKITNKGCSREERLICKTSTLTHFGVLGSKRWQKSEVLCRSQIDRGRTFWAYQLRKWWKDTKRMNIPFTTEGQPE